MKILELKFPKTILDASAVLRKHGYKNIGSDSSYGSVYHKAGEKSVLKLFSSKDNAYKDFVSFCIKHQDNPHFPRFSRNVIEIKGTDYFAVRTELLHKGNKDKLRKLSKFFYILVYLKKSPNIKTFYENTPTDEIVFDYLIDDNDTETAEILTKQFINFTNDSLYNAFDMVIDNFYWTYSYDMHDDNMMMRGDTVVIIDPIKPKL